VSRNTKLIVIEDGRDKGKAFVLTELPAARAEKWALRAFLGLAKSGVEVPDEVAGMGMAGIATLGLKALGGIEWAYLEPLLDEMFTCVQRMPDQRQPEVVRALIDDDIEEISTRLRLRKEVFGLHVDFSKAAAVFGSAPAAASGQLAA